MSGAMATASTAAGSGGECEAAAEDSFKCMLCGAPVRRSKVRPGVANEAIVRDELDKLCVGCRPVLAQSRASPPTGTGGSQRLRSPHCRCPCYCKPACDGVAGQPSTCFKPGYPSTDVSGGGPATMLRGDEEDDDGKGEGEGVHDVPLFTMRTSRDAMLRVVKTVLADLPVPSTNGRFTDGNTRALGVKQRTAKDFLTLYPQAPMCSPREGVEQRATAAMFRSKAEAMDVFATSHVTMAVFVHEVVSREELQELEAFQASTSRCRSRLVELSVIHTRRAQLTALELQSMEILVEVKLQLDSSKTVA